MRPMASSSLQNTANNYAQWAAGQDAKYAHIAPADKQKVGLPSLCRAAAPACRVRPSAAKAAGSVCDVCFYLYKQSWPQLGGHLT